MASRYNFERFVEYGTATLFRAALAYDAYVKLFSIRPQLYIRGSFTADGGTFDAPHWVPVEYTSKGFRGKDGFVYLPVGKFDFMLDR